jgi:hypothetical protein
VDWGTGKWLVNGHSLFWGNESVLKLDGGDDCTTLWMK